MQKRHDSGPASMDVQALYSVAALARVANVSRHLLLRVLRSNGVTLVHGGRALFVPLADIRRKIPPLWESLQAAEELRRGRRTRA